MERKSMRHGARCMVAGTIELTVATWQHVDSFVHKMPWFAVCAVILVSVTVAGAYMMQARAERNTAEAAYYQIQKKYDSLKICVNNNY